VADQTPQVLAPARATAPLVCRLRHRTGRQGPSPTSGEVEIENVSGAPVEIEVSMHPLQYLTLAVTDSRGAAVPAPAYGNLFSPRETPYLWRLATGGKYTHNVSLLGLLREEKLPSGTYVVRAVYRYKELRAVSEPLTVELPERR
jgi:hypothetical protein